MRGFGGQDASTESINVLFCLFVCPQSLRKPQGENENGEEKDSEDSSSAEMRKKHQRKMLKMERRLLCCIKMVSINTIFLYMTQTV